jgi:hypothetical protein
LSGVGGGSARKKRKGHEEDADVEEGLEKERALEEEMLHSGVGEERGGSRGPQGKRVREEEVDKT